MKRLVYTKVDTLADDTLSIDRENFTITSRISTDSVDSDREVVMTKGLNFGPIERTRSVFFCHDPYQVIGKMLWIKSDVNSVKALTKFAAKESELAAECFELAAGGYIRGWSIGMDWVSIKRRKPTAQDYGANPRWAKAESIITDADVLEYSLCPIPANPEALTLAEQKGLVVHTKSFWSEIEKPKEPLLNFVARKTQIVRQPPLTIRVVESMIQREIGKALGR